MNGGVQSDLAILESNKREHLEDFHIIIIRLQQEIILSGDIFSPTTLLFQYMKAFSKSDELRAFIVPKIKCLITFLDNNGKSSVYIGGYIHGIYSYL